VKNIGVLTSGGDAPGMNAAIRSIVRIAKYRGFRVVGFRRGWDGLMSNDSMELTPRSVSGIIQLGGTILYTSRSPEFDTKEGIGKATETLRANDIDGLVVIGGDGSMRGALALSGETDALIVGVPSTIDNDVYGTSETIGFDTAVNTAVEEIDKIRDTAVSHQRVFIVEVMGRNRGFLASMVGLTAGAEVVLVPEVKREIEDVCRTVRANAAKGKKSGIIVAAEGVGDTRELAKDIEEHTGTEVRLSILGYAQRGGSPTARSRFLAEAFSNEAVRLLSEGQGGRVVGLEECKITSIGLAESCGTEKPLDPGLLELANILAT
jgi:6-phosphofructokinase 1